jgi:hypothetical protein
MALPVKRYKGFSEWIPSTDINGVDAQTSVLREARNIDYSGAFVEPAVAPSTVTLPTSIASAVTAGFDLISCQLFHHSERGWTWFYVMYQFDDPDHLLKFFVREDGTADATELSIDEYNDSSDPNDNVVFADKPTNINYAFADDQLKINLNISAEFTIIDETDVTVNLTLFNNSLSQETGWQLVPRWLGWQYQKYSKTDFITNTTVSNYSTDFEGANWYDTLLAGMTAGISGAAALSTNTYWSPSNSMLLNTASTAGKMTFGNLDYAVNLKFKMVYGGTSNPLILSYEGDNGVVVKQTFTIEYLNENFRGTTNGNAWIIDFPLPVLENGKVEFYAGAGDAVYIDDVEIEFNREVEGIILAKHFDGQRSFVISDTFNVNNSSKLLMPDECRDKRVSSIELYLKRESIYYLVAEAQADWSLPSPSVWTLSTGVWETLLSAILEETTDTLNFNYGLGASVSTMPGNGTISKEVLFRGRTYYVTGSDALVRQSHLAGNGRLQPDSFPFDRANLFGYFDVPESEIVKGLAVTSLDELAVLSNKTEYVYFIQGGQISFKKIRAVNGGSGLIDAKQLTTELDGRPAGQVFAWYDYTGIYIYGGGISAPKDITTNKIQQYWLETSKSTKDNGIVFYNKLKNEVWIVLGNTVLLYELFYDRWRTYQFTNTITEYLGYKDNVIYFMTDAGEIKALDYAGVDRLEGYIQTHYTTDLQFAEGEKNYAFPSAEQVRKVMNDFSLSSANTSGNKDAFYEVTFFIDGNELSSEVLNMRTDMPNDVIPALPYLSYGKLSIGVVVPAIAIKLNEISYSFITLEQSSARIALPSTSVPAKVI